MTGDARWTRIRELFERAFDEQPPDPAVWLDERGIDDWQVREEVISLLRHHAAAGSFLAQPAGDELSRLMADERSLEPGQAIGPYRIVREIGRGGMGRVYLAEDTRLGRRVAIKALAPALTADASHRERLRREARAAAALTHPGICTVYALEEIDGDLFIATEFVDGRTLRAEIEEGRRPDADEALRTARELAAALAHAHGHGVTHRDLKPDNVMRTRDGGLKILDFGLARLDGTPASVDTFVTQPGTVVGTPAYMAPEQLKGERADARSDVFALGVLLYQYTSGAHPFGAGTPLATIGRIIDSDPDPLYTHRPDLPGSLIACVERCLEKVPADRFTSAADIVAALDGGGARRPRGSMTIWWRTHQLVVIATYFLACVLAWQIKEWLAGFTTAIFITAGITATVAGLFRGHLLFTERVNGAGLAAEHRRAMPVTLAMDGLLGLVLLADGILLSGARPLPAVIAMALGAGIVLARVVIEPSTTSASFRR